MQIKDESKDSTLRRKDKAIPKKELEEVLKKGRVCRLAMASGNKPYLVPLCYGYKDGILFFHCAKEGRKINLLRVNPSVWFEIETDVEPIPSKDPCSWTMRYRCVMGEGEAVFITDLDEKKQALSVILRQYGSSNFDFPMEAMERTTVFKVLIRFMTGKQSGFVQK